MSASRSAGGVEALLGLPWKPSREASRPRARTSNNRAQGPRLSSAERLGLCVYGLWGWRRGGAVVVVLLVVVVVVLVVVVVGWLPPKPGVLASQPTNPPTTQTSKHPTCMPRTASPPRRVATLA